MYRGASGINIWNAALNECYDDLLNLWLPEAIQVVEFIDNIVVAL